MKNLQFQQKHKEFIRQLPHQYQYQGPSRKIVLLPGGVTVILTITYCHRQKTPAKASQTPERGLYPPITLLNLSISLTSYVPRQMARAAALLSDHEETTEMLSDHGITVSVNKLREVCGRIGRKLAQKKSSGSMQSEYKTPQIPSLNRINTDRNGTEVIKSGRSGVSE